MKNKLVFGIFTFLLANFAIAQQSELLTNPDFDNGTNGWWAHGADISTEGGVVLFDINNAGANPWDTQLGQGKNMVNMTT